MRTFATGIAGLDRLLGEIRVPYTMLIAGHPGAGKTTLASTICYHNTLRGGKCLYITLYEDREKLYSFMERLGLRLREAESRGLFKYLKLPLSSDIEGTIDAINKAVSEGYDIVVLDSVTALLDSIKDRFEKRAWLLNYFYQLPQLFNGLLILVSELPYGEERLDLGSVEFVVDATIILKHRVEDGLLVRLIEVRKSRGTPIYVAEAPFTIAEGSGIEVFTPPILEELPEQGGELEPPCKVYRERVTHFHQGFLINIFFPPETVYGREALLCLLALAIKHNLKILVISYITPPLTLIDTLTKTLGDYGVDHRDALEVLRKFMVVRALNPYAYSVAQLSARELMLIDNVKPNIVVFHGIHVARYMVAEYQKVFRELYNEVLYLKSRNISVVRIGSCVDETICSLESSISDVTFRIIRTYNEDKTDYKIHVFRRYIEPSIVSSSENKSCLMECIEIIKSYIAR